MIKPETALVMIPCHDGRVDSYCTGGLLSSRDLFAQVGFINGISQVNLARNMIVNRFLAETAFMWLVCIDSDIEFKRIDLEMLLSNPTSSQATKDENGNDLVVVAEYSRKVESLDPVRFGLGFARIHRSVFAALESLRTDDGRERLERFAWQGQLLTDYFPSGAYPPLQWYGEDTGFFHCVRLAGIYPRIEQRTRLTHWGRFGYPYVQKTIAS